MGFSYKQIASEMGLSANTIKVYIARCFWLPSLALWPAYAIKHGIVTSEEYFSWLPSV